MRTIHKYPLTPGLTNVLMPAGGEALTVQVQDGIPMLWARVDTDIGRVTRRVFAVPTGASLDELGPMARYIATVQIPAVIPLVFHVFEEVTV